MHFTNSVVLFSIMSDSIEACSCTADNGLDTPGSRIRFVNGPGGVCPIKTKPNIC